MNVEVGRLFAFCDLLWDLRGRCREKE